MLNEDGYIVYGKPDDNGIEVEVDDAASTWLVGTWAHDTVSGTIQEVLARVAERMSHGDDDALPLKVYQLREDGELHRCGVHTHPPADGYREVHVTFNGKPLVSARFKV